MAHYDSLLLRIWCRDGTDGERWISQVEHVQSGASVRFRDREALLAYLATIIAQQGPAGETALIDPPTDTRTGEP